MRPAPNALIEMYRQRVDGARTAVAGNNGYFLVPYKERRLAVIAADELWDHVSVSLPDRTPTWEEMCHVKSLFFTDDEWVMQLHPPKSKNISMHDFCLHLWRPHDQAIPMPPSWMVGLPGVSHQAMSRMTDRERQGLAKKLKAQFARDSGG